MFRDGEIEIHTSEKYIQLALITVSRSSRELDIFMWKDHTEENIQNTKVIDPKIFYVSDSESKM